MAINLLEQIRSPSRSLILFFGFRTSLGELRLLANYFYDCSVVSIRVRANCLLAFES